MCRFSCRFMYHLCVNHVHITLNKTSMIFDIMYIFTCVPSDVHCKLLNDTDVAGQFVLSWKQHLVCCVNQDYGRTSVLRSLQPDEVLIIMDWVMKFLPISFREKHEVFTHILSRKTIRVVWTEGYQLAHFCLDLSRR